MSRIKEWAMQNQECTVCGNLFMPAVDNKHTDIANPTCSYKCQSELEEVFERLADLRDAEDRYAEGWILDD